MSNPEQGSVFTAATLSRRDFFTRLFSGLVVSLTPDIGSGSPTISNTTEADSTFPERGTTLQITARREGLNLLCEPRTSPLVQRINYLWEEYQDWHLPSPAILEGYATNFGPSSIARGQLLTVVAELRRQVKAGILNRHHVSSVQQRMLELGNSYDQSGLEALALDSQEYEEGFDQWLATEGYVGVIAPKSSEDFGRTAQVSVWNYLQERWVEVGTAIALNTSTYETFSGFMDRHLEVREFGQQMRWIGDVSRNIIRAAEIPDDITHPTQLRLTFLENGLDYSCEFPLYRERTPLNTEYRQLGRQLAARLRPNRFFTQLSNLSLPATFEFSVEEMTYSYPMHGEYIQAFLFYQQGLPLMRETSIQDFVDALGSTTEASAALPLSPVALAVLCERLAQHGIFQRRILVEQSSLFPTTGGLFFVENLADGTLYPQLGSSGFIYQGSVYKAHSETGVLESIPIRQFVGELNENQRMLCYSPSTTGNYKSV